MTMTEDQDVVAAKARIAELKAAYSATVTKYTDIANVARDGAEARAAALEAQKRGAEYFNYAEEFVGNSDLLGAHASDFWAQGFAEDCVEILSSMPMHYRLLRHAFDCFPDLRQLSTLPGPTAFANMQRMLVAHISKPLVKNLRAEFKENGLPTYGFDNIAKTRSPSRWTKPSLVVGVLAVIAVLVLAMFNPDLNRFQRAVVWAVLALGLGSLASEMSGFVELKFKKLLVAGGGMAIFALVYLISPTDPSEASQGMSVHGLPATTQRE